MFLDSKKENQDCSKEFLGNKNTKKRFLGKANDRNDHYTTNMKGQRLKIGGD